MKKSLFYFILLIGLTSIHAYAGGQKIIKWVDKNGVTQYGDRPPMATQAKKSSVLNNQGVTVQKIEQRKSTANEDKALAEQARYDKALLASYNSIDEIEISRKRNTRIDAIALEALEKKHQKLQLSLAEKNKTLLLLAKENKPAPAETIAAIEKNTTAIEKLEAQIAVRQATIDKINKRYEKDKIRYTELESRKGRLSNIKFNNQNIADIQKWRNDTQRRIDFYESEALRFKRSGSPVPRHVSSGLLNATRELARAEQELITQKQAVKKETQQLSR